MNKAEQLIACLEGEIAKRDEELSACRVAVENCEVFRARIAELCERVIQLEDEHARNLDWRDQCKALSAELAAIKAQEPVWRRRDGVMGCKVFMSDKCYQAQSATMKANYERVAPVSEVKAQGVLMPEQECKVFAARYICNWDGEGDICYALVEKHKDGSFIHIENGAPLIEYKGDKILNLWPLGLAAPAQQVSVPQCVFDWFEAKQAHVNAVDAYNARLAFVREHMPFGTSVDPEYQIMEAADRKVRNLVGPMFNGLRDLAAAPAAPAAAAGIVDMYRHLQKVTPYRFKKIQDASITDGGDVMYFHKDRFDAALLADMAAHCAAKGVV